MTLLRPVLALRRLVVLAAPLAACVAVENPGFIPDPPSGADSSTASETGSPGTTPTGSSVGSGETGTVDTGTTSPVLTGEDPTTTVSTLPSDTTTTDATTTDATTGDVSTSDATTGGSSGTTGGCAETTLVEMKPAGDAFFIAGGTDNATSCKYYDNVAGVGFACKHLNFGTTGALRIARMADGIDAMYAAYFSQDAISALVKQGVEIDHAELAIIVYDQIKHPIELRVGMITESWIPGEKNGQLALMGDSSFASSNIGFQAAPWTGEDGPRGASFEVATLSVPVDFGQHEEFISTPFAIDPWLGDEAMNFGLVLSFPKNVVVPTYGPGVKAMESVDFKPTLRIHYCMP